MQTYYYLSDNEITPISLTQKQQNEWQGSGTFFNSREDAEQILNEDLAIQSTLADALHDSFEHGEDVAF